MNTDPVIEVAVLDILAYKADRSTVIGRPQIVLMLNPICGCVLNRAVVTIRSPTDALAAAFSSWQPAQSAQTLVVDAGREFRSSSLVKAAVEAGCKIHFSSRISPGTIERALMKITQRMNQWQIAKKDSTRLTLPEIKRRVWIKVAIHNKKIRRGDRSRGAGLICRVAGVGVPLSIRRAYLTVLQTSLECGFDAEQVGFIWQTASYSYPADLLRMMFEEIVSQFHSNTMYQNYCHKDEARQKSLFKLPIEILEGEGAAAIRTLAHVKAQYDNKPFIWINDLHWARPIGSWADLTYTLLEKLVKDGLATEDLRCKLFARDLGL
jgi:hypothetical protein